MNVVELDPYRERRTVRRVAAVGLVAACVYGALIKAAEAWELVEWAIRKGADLLDFESEGGET